MQFAPFTLGEWFDEHFFDADYILGESGVQPYSLKELRQVTGLQLEELDSVVFTDSPFHGSDGLRDAMARRWREGDRQQVMVTHGSSEAIFLVMAALLQPDDEVIVLTPCYQPLFSLPEAFGCKVKTWELRSQEQFAPQLDDLRRMLTPQTKMVVVNFPNNPTGASITPAQQQKLVDMVAEYNAYLLWDSAFVELSYDVSPLSDPWKRYKRTITIGTLTKAYGLSGMCIGWCLATPEILKQCVHVREYTTLNLSPLTQFIAERVIDNLDEILHRRLQQASINLAYLDEWVAANSHFVTWVRPQGGVTAFIRVKGLSNSGAFCDQLAQQQKVFLMPGTCFNYPDYLRVGFGGSNQQLREGLARLTDFLERQEYSQAAA